MTSIRTCWKISSLGYLSSYTRKARTKLNKGTKYISDFIFEWTPFCLLISYFVFSTNLYLICSNELLAVFWFIYMATNFYVAATTVAESFLSLAPIRDARRAVKKCEENGWIFHTPDSELLKLDLIIVAYLPNEKDIILDRIHYALEKIVYPREKITINIVYNTPSPMPILESELLALEAKHDNLRIIKVEGSTSKADNLNYFLTLKTSSDIISIFDCDHYTHPHGPRWAVERFMSDKNVDIVQGRCVVFNSRASLLTRLITVEFDKIYAVSHPGRATMFGFGLFCGSNGYWRASLLKDLKMDKSMLTEDIDSALRAFTIGSKTVHDLNVISYELAPTTLNALKKQRLRWAQGWAQASLRHLPLAFKKTIVPRPFRERFGMFSLLLVRELSYYLITQNVCLVLSIVITNFPKTPAALAKLVFFQFPMSEWFFIVSALCLTATLAITNWVKSEFASWSMIVLFSLFYPFYLVTMAVIGLYGHARQVVNYSNWNPTVRS